MVKLLELTSLGVFAGCSMVGTIPSPGIPGWVFQFGALGLVAFMVLQNYRQQTATIKVVKEKDKQIAEYNERMARLVSEYTDATRRLAECLEDRPCIQGDQRIQEK